MMDVQAGPAVIAYNETALHELVAIKRMKDVTRPSLSQMPYVNSEHIVNIKAFMWKMTTWFLSMKAGCLFVTHYLRACKPIEGFSDCGSLRGDKSQIPTAMI